MLKVKEKHFKMTLRNEKSSTWHNIIEFIYSNCIAILFDLYAS